MNLITDTRNTNQKRLNYHPYSAFYTHILILWCHYGHIHCVSLTLRYAHVAMCNIRYILFDFWIGEICLRLKCLTFSVYSHMFSILLFCPHMSHVFYNHWLDAIASSYFYAIYVQILLHFILYMLLYCISLCVSQDHIEKQLCYINTLSSTQYMFSVLLVSIYHAIAFITNCDKITNCYGTVSLFVAICDCSNLWRVKT